MAKILDECERAQRIGAASRLRESMRMHPEWKHRPGTDLLKLEYHCRRDYGENSHSDLPPEWIVQEFASIAANSQRQRTRFPVEVNGPCHCPRDPNDPNLSHQVDRDDGWQATWKRRRCSGVPDRGSRTVAPWAIKVPTPTSHRRLAADWLGRARIVAQLELSAAPQN